MIKQDLTISPGGCSKENKLKAVIRVDASSKIGSGHVVRCLTLAEGLRQHGIEVLFVCRPHEGHLCDMIEERGFSLSRLSAPRTNKYLEDAPGHAAWLGSSWQEDAEETLEAINIFAENPAWLVVDHYALDQGWELFMRPKVGRILVIDDLADRLHDCDVLVDQCLVDAMGSRYAGKVPLNCRTLLGPMYALLQPIYAELHDRIPPREGPIQRILIYFGGTDADNLTGRVLGAFLSLNRSDINVDVVLSRFSPHAGAINRQVDGHDNVFLHHGMASLAPLIAKADLSIGACGTTTWERLCLGLPSLVITMANNQRGIAEELNRQSLIEWLGHGKAVSESMIGQAISTHIQRGQDGDWSRRCQAVLDGGGLMRVCAAMLVNVMTLLSVRHARLSDEAVLLDWANDVNTRRNAFSQDLISTGTHRVWFWNRLRNFDVVQIYIVEIANGVPIGQVRFERSDANWEIHFVLAPIFRGIGIGRMFLEAALIKFWDFMPDMVIFGLVKEQNYPSRKIFEALGFEKCSNSNGIIRYERRFTLVRKKANRDLADMASPFSATRDAFSLDL